MASHLARGESGCLNRRHAPGRYGSATAVFGPRAALRLDPRAREGVGSRSRLPNRRHQPRSVTVLTGCRARCRRVSACTSLARPKPPRGTNAPSSVAISPPVRGHGSQTFLTETLTDGPGRTWWSETALHEHKNGGPAWAPPPLGPVLYQLSSGTKNQRPSGQAAKRINKNTRSYP